MLINILNTRTLPFSSWDTGRVAPLVVIVFLYGNSVTHFNICNFVSQGQKVLSSSIIGIL